MDLVDQIAMDITEPPLLIEDMHVAPKKNLTSSYIATANVTGSI